jgi:hypothetical protein
MVTASKTTSAVIFHGRIYVAGGNDSTGTPVAKVYSAKIGADGTLAAWQTLSDLPVALAYHQLATSGGYLYVLGGTTVAVDPVSNAQSASAQANIYLEAINIRNGGLSSLTWNTNATAMGKAREKFTAVAAGSYLLVSGGLYNGASTGSSEQSYAAINADGSIGSQRRNRQPHDFGLDVWIQLLQPRSDALCGHLWQSPRARAWGQRYQHGRAARGRLVPALIERLGWEELRRPLRTDHPSAQLRRGDHGQRRGQPRRDRDQEASFPAQSAFIEEGSRNGSLVPVAAVMSHEDSDEIIACDAVRLAPLGSYCSWWWSWPRISPPGCAEVWMLAYATPERIASSTVAKSRPATP